MTLEEKTCEQRMEKIERIRALGLEPYGFRYLEGRLAAAEVREAVERGGEPEVKVAGRVTAVRMHGKTTFCDIFDRSGAIQVFLRKNDLGETTYTLVRMLDAGDIIGVEGKAGRTRTGEVTIFARTMTLLSKALLVPPEKRHGLKDVETRYRRRYVDLVSNPEVRDRFALRHRLIWFLRNLFVEEGFVEVETPMMQPVPGGAEARPFVTHHNTLDLDLYLRIAPELYLKRLLVGGFERVFELNRSFRNEGVSPRHNPEFTMLEAYLAYGDYTDMMRITERVVSESARVLLGADGVDYAGRRYDLRPPYRRLDYETLFSERYGCGVRDEAGVLRAAREAGLDEMSHWAAVDKLLDLALEALAPEAPVFVVRHPVEISPLAKHAGDDPRLTERFELFVAGMEVANGFSELNDPVEQRRRFEQQLQHAREHGLPRVLDEDFLTALSYGMPPAGGLGIGVDRLAMLLTGVRNIRDVILFPTLRPKE